MPVETTEREIGRLLGEITAGEIKLPEIQRGYIWKPTQVAKLIDSLYRQYPTGSFLFWKTSETPLTRAFAIDGEAPQPVVQPLYLLDGQQRLTALSRALGEHQGTEIVFNVQTEAFQNQSAATQRDARWVRVRDVVEPEADLFSMVAEICDATGLDRREIGRRLQRLAAIRSRKYHMEILTDLPYEEITQIFVRVNSGGRSLRTSDLALATLSARWPGVLAKLEEEADRWVAQGWGHIDTTFLTRALTGAVLGRGLSTWSHARLVNASDEALEHGWATVQRGLSVLIPLIKNNLKISHSILLPSMMVLLPLIVLLGERPDEPLPAETADAIMYWLLVATIRNRYSGATDTTLGQDIPATRADDPVHALMENIGILGTRVEVTPLHLAGRSSNSPYFLLSYLITQEAGARDWWYGTNIAIGGTGGQSLEYHHIHPQATLKRDPAKYTKSAINELANLAFISARANKRISDRSPGDYFPEVGTSELEKHFVPLAESLRTSSAYREFLAERRALLASAMTAYLDKFRPAWLDGTTTADPLAGAELDFTLYRSDWDAGRVIVVATHQNRQWTAAIALPALESAVNAAGEGLNSDVTVGGESIPAYMEGEELQIRLGPFLVTGTPEKWREILDREIADARPLSQAPVVATEAWEDEPVTFPITNVE